jgi:hypothetical protein
MCVSAYPIRIVSDTRTRTRVTQVVTGWSEAEVVEDMVACKTNTRLLGTLLIPRRK